MEPRRQEKSPEPVKNQKKRFQIVKLEERVAPSNGHYNKTSTTYDSFTNGVSRSSGFLSD